MTSPTVPRSQVLFIGGRAGVGKTTVAAEIHANLARLAVEHCWIEGDSLDMAYPRPWEQGYALAEKNLATMWRNYKAIGHSRLVYTNTASVRGDVMPSLIAALGDDPLVYAVLLTSSDEEADLRLEQREVGTGLAWHSARSRAASRELETLAPGWVRRINTDSRTIIEIAQEVVDDVKWAVDSGQTRSLGR